MAQLRPHAMANAPNAYGSNKGSAKKDEVTQGLVTMNADASAATVNTRLANAANRKPVIGTAAPQGDVDAKRFLHIRPWQLALTSTTASKKVVNNMSMTSRNLGGLRPQIFTSFNLYDATKSVDQVAEDLVPLGFTDEHHVYGELSQADKGMAVVVAGSFTTVNTGLSNWSPGQRIKWVPYDPAEIQSGEFDAARRSKKAVTPEHPTGYYPVRLEPFDFNKDVRRAATAAMRTTFVANASTPGKLVDFMRLRTDVADMGTAEAYTLQRIRADVAMCLRFYAIAQGSGVQTRDMAALFGFGSLNNSGKSTDAAAAVGILRQLYAAELGEVVEPQSALGALSGEVAKQAQGAPADAFNALCSMIHRAQTAVVAESLAYSAPGAGALVNT